MKSEKTVACILAVVMLSAAIFSVLTGCEKTDVEKDLVFDDTDEYTENYETPDYKYNYNVDPENINSADDAINSILDLRYMCEDEVFNSYDFYDQIKKALLEKDSFGFDKKEENDKYKNCNYSWLEGNKIDYAALSDRILGNSISHGEIESYNIGVIAELLPKVFDSNLKYMKKYFPNHPYDVVYHNLDNLFVTNVEEDANGYYDQLGNCINISSHTINESEEDLRIVLSHELYHLMFRNTCYDDGFIVCGASFWFDDFDDLKFNFIEEYVATCYSFYSVGKEIDPVYAYSSSEEWIDLLAKSSGVRREDVMKYWLNGDYDSFQNLFTDKMKGERYVLEALTAINKGLEYGSYIPMCEDTHFLGNCCSYAAFILYQNVCIDGIQKIEKNEMTLEELKSKLDDFMQDVVNLQYSSCNMPQLKNAVNAINSILQRYETIS